MVVYTKGKYDCIQYCCGAMAECRDYRIIERNEHTGGYLRIESYVLYYCPFCGGKIEYVKKKLTKKQIGDAL